MAAPTQATTPAQIKSEDVLSAKTDLCLSNAIVKAGTGLAVGVVASAILFRRRPWPVLLGLGFGFGQGYSDCERVFNPAAIPGYRIHGEADKAASPFTLNRSTSSAPAAAEASKKLESATQQTKSKVSELVQQAKVKASEAAAKVEDKAEQVKDKVIKGEKKVEAKVDDLKDGKKWV
ncbi:Mic10p [Sporobolomyces koalae]|uniref:Mic10p n=1 Tax=Sporobolomyces koalae TaxID=500713 RepID=UPI0031771E2D